MADLPPVSITKSISVYPNQVLNNAAVESSILNLSNLDRQCPNLMYMVFFYKPSALLKELCFDSIFTRLKSGLEATLSIWYPAAGRLTFYPRGKQQKQLNILCNNAGAILVQAVTPAMISDLVDLSFYSDFFENLVFKPVIGDNITEMPLVAAQVTKFNCGGYCIGIGTSHSLFDGTSAYDFLRAWASQCRHDHHQIVMMYRPVHERGRLLVENLDNDREYHTNTSINRRPTAIDDLYQLIRQQQHLASGYPGDDDQETSSRLVFKTFHLSIEMIEKLKKRVVLVLGDHDDYQKRDKLQEFSCSSFELIAAHLWKERTNALGLGRDRKVCLQFAVDARNRMMPPLPVGFSGNAYVLASVVSTAGELKDQNLGFIINKIKEAKNSVTHDYVNAYIKALDQAGPQQQAATSTHPPSLPPELTVVSDWTRVPFHRVNFFGGKEEEEEATATAAYASPLVPPIPQVAYFMQNPNECRAIDVRIGLLPKIQAVFSHHFINTI